MTQKYWIVEGVHLGKRISDLPITYLLWFVGSHQMRRSRWAQCQVALHEIYRRLTNSRENVEADLIADLRPRTAPERQDIKKRAYHYRDRQIMERTKQKPRAVTSDSQP